MGKRRNSIHKSMKYVAAYALLVLGGNESPSEADLNKALKAAGCEVNADNVTSVCNALKGKQLHEVVAAGYGKIASLSLGGGGGSGTSQTQATGVAAAKEEVKVEVKEEEE